MDVLPQSLRTRFNRPQRSPELEDYDDLVAQLRRSREHRDVALTQGRRASHFQNPTTLSLNAESPEQNSISPRSRQIHTAPLAPASRNPRFKIADKLPMDQQWHQNGQMPAESAAPDFQDNEANNWFANSQDFLVDPSFDATFAAQLTAQNGDMPFSQQAHGFWPSDVSGMAGYSIEAAQTYGLVSAPGASGPSMIAPIMRTVHNPVNSGPMAEAAAMADLETVFRGGPVSEDGDPFGSNEQHHLLQQPTAISGAAINQSNNVIRLHDRAEQMMRSPPDHSALPANGPDTSPEGPQTFSQDSPTPSRSPSSIAESTDQLSDMVYMHQDSRRPSMTNDLTQNVSNIQLQHSQSSEDMADMQQLLFRKPSLPGSVRSTLAERRRQQTPNGLNLQQQRPHTLNIGRTVSSSAINQIPNGSRYPTSPHGSLRRYKSSNVVLSGRVQKSAANSSRNSPMVASFSDAVSVQSSQATPQPSALQTQTSMSLASPRHMPDSYPEMAPSTASTTMFTPGIHSGDSVPVHSFQTPVTTPYGYHHHQGYGGPQVPPASGIPQSAPAHVQRFDRPASPPGMPTMPNTPANYQFPQQMHQPQQMFNMPVQMHHMQQNMAVVPSQHGLAENMGFMPPQDPAFLHAGFPGGFHPHDAYAHGPMGPYVEWDQWARHQFAAKDLEVKFDAGCDRLSKEVASGKATILPIEKRDFAFQNTSSGDMRKQLDKSEP